MATVSELLDRYEHRLPSDLADASLARILRAVGEVGTNAAKQGVVVGQALPWWRVVGRFNARLDLEYVVVDVMPVTKGHPPVVVHGPVKSRAKAQQWANETALMYCQVTGSFLGPEWPWE